jgi:hypothetical protein
MRITDEEVISSFEKRYENLHPLIFHRSLEKAEDSSELFDILENIPLHPISWDDSKRRWIKIIDFCFFENAKSLIKKS